MMQKRRSGRQLLREIFEIFFALKFLQKIYICKSQNIEKFKIPISCLCVWCTSTRRKEVYYISENIFTKVSFIYGINNVILIYCNICNRIFKKSKINLWFWFIPIYQPNFLILGDEFLLTKKFFFSIWVIHQTGSCTDNFLCLHVHVINFGKYFRLTDNFLHFL